MAARLRYPELAPEGYAALRAFGHYVNAGTALEAVLLGMVYLRASVLNGCEFCTELHKAELSKHNEPESRIDAVVTAPRSEVFTPREQAALRWTEVITHLDQDHASDEEFAAVSHFFAGRELVDLTFAIANINALNRMGVAFRPTWKPRRPDAGTAATNTTHPYAPSSIAGPPVAAQAGVTDSPEANSQLPADDDGGKVGED